MNNKGFSEKTRLYLRIVIGAYLLYTNYTLLRDWDIVKENNHEIFMIIAIIIFTVAALLIIGFSAKKLLQLNKESNNLENDSKDSAEDHTKSDAVDNIEENTKNDIENEDTKN